MTAQPMCIGVVPGRERQARRRLLDALEEAFGVRFVPSDSVTPGALRAAVVFAGGADDDVADVPLVLSEQGGSGALTPEGALVTLGAAQDVDARLRGRSFTDESAGQLSPVAADGRPIVMASTSAGPIWVKDRTGLERHRVSGLPTELHDGERLKDRFRAGRFMDLLPVIHLLRQVSGYDRWVRPPLRAAFVIDDPNLHWPSYGFLRFHDLARHAEAHGYHVGIAAVPRDLGWAHPATVAVVRDSPALSLLMHGNDHIRHELARARTHQQALMVAAQAWRRVEVFERRHGVPVARVMVPPHGRCSQQMMHAFLRLGYEAVCYSGALRHEQVTPLAGWHMADVEVGGGIPGIPRLGIHRSTEERVLRAYLDQPVVLVLHHDDLRGGYDQLGEIVEELGGVGGFQWMSFSELVRTGFQERTEGDLLRVRAFSRRIGIQLASALQDITVEAPGGSEEDTVIVRSVTGDFGASGPIDARLPAPPPGPAEIMLRRPNQVEADRVRAPVWSPWPVVRRTLTEARDRATPLLPMR